MPLTELKMSASSLASRASSRTSVSSTGGALSPAALLRRISLPAAAVPQCADAPAAIPAAQPVLLYDTYTSTKVRAASLHSSREGDGGFVALGPTILIPDAYTGWFSLVSSDGTLCASPLTSLIDLVNARPRFFLTRFDLSAYVKEMDQNDMDRITYRRTTIGAGNVLKFLGIFEDVRGNKNSSNGFDETNDTANKYAQCINHSNQVVFIPMSARGRFFPTAPRGSSDKSQVFLMSQLVSTFRLPLTVRLISGFLPAVPQGFTGLLRLEKVEREAVILACTMTSEARATLFEIEVASNFLLRPIGDSTFTKTPIFLKSVSYCVDEAQTWKRQIKVIHHVTDDDSETHLRRYVVNRTSSNSLGFPNAFFGDSSVEKQKGRERERSRTRSDKNNFRLRDFSKDVIRRSTDRNKPNKERRDESKSRESRLAAKVKDKIQGISRNKPCIVNSEFISIRVQEDKLSGKKANENRKVSKQNTYIFQNERILKHQDKKRTITQPESPQLLPQNIAIQEYGTVVDDISHRNSRRETKMVCDVYESQYSEICENKIVSDAKSGVVRVGKRRT